MLLRTSASHLVSAINADLAPPTPAALTQERHLRLDMHDVVEPCEGACAPASEHVGQLIEFVRSWDRKAPLLIHCYAGLSRSTAAAFITLCALNPEAPETAIAQALRQASDTAVPNRRFVSLADAFLRREGRMLAALDVMGPNRIASECVPFGVIGHHGPVLAKSTDRAA
ncbi:MAG: protein tyrosine phosphatase [Hyphomicrobium sp.]